MEIFYVLAYGLIYFLSGLLLFVLNLFVFEKLTSFDVSIEVFEVQNKSLAHIIKWQVLGQSIMIWTLIYFLWANYNNWFAISNVVNSLFDIFIFWIFWIIIFQSFLYLLSKFTPLTKEIIIDNNESLWMIIGSILVWISIILSVSLYSY